MNIKKILVLTACSTMLAACSKNSPTGTTDTTTTKKNPPPDTVAYTQWGTVLPDANTFYPGTQVAKLTDPALASASGIGASRAYPGMFWIEDDQGGGENDIYLVDTMGTKRAVFSVTGSSDRDWTDMTIGPGPDTLTTYIYIADIGDSKANHSYSTIYRFPEPQTPLGSTLLTGATATADQITFKYPASDGPRDAETILLDPQSKDIYIVDKNANGNMFYLPYPQSTDTTITAKKVLTNMNLGDSRCGAISSSRKELFLKSYNAIFYWKISPGESILDAVLATPVTEPYNVPEVQGEAFCLTPNDSEYWTTSKFTLPTPGDLDRYKRK